MDLLIRHHGWDDYYPFGLVMSGRSSNTSNPDDLYKFTGHELDEEAGLGLIHMNARGMDPVIGRMLQIDSRAEKYPGISPYTYVLNNPVGFTDMTGDTVDIDDRLLQVARYGEGHERAGEQKDLADMTNEEKQAYYFQQWWGENGEDLEAVFGIGGVFESTNISFVSASNMPDKDGFYFGIFDADGRTVDRGLTTFGMQGSNPAYYNSGQKYMPGFGVDKLDFIVYFDNYKGYRAKGRGPVRAETPEHELGHVLYIFNSFRNKTQIETGLYQHTHSLKYPSLKNLKGN